MVFAAVLAGLLGGSDSEPLRTARVLTAAVCTEGDAALRDLFERHLSGSIELDLRDFGDDPDAPRGGLVTADVALDRLLVVRRRMAPCALALEHAEVVHLAPGREQLIANLSYSSSAEGLHGRHFDVQARFRSTADETRLTALTVLERDSAAPEPRP